MADYGEIDYGAQANDETWKEWKMKWTVTKYSCCTIAKKGFAEDVWIFEISSTNWNVWRSKSYMIWEFDFENVLIFVYDQIVRDNGWQWLSGARK